MFDFLVEKLDIKQGFKIIDIGCGTGNNSFKLSKLVGDKGMVVAIDPIKERIEKAREMYGTEFPNLRFEVASAQDSCQFGSDFDLAVSSTVFHWISDSEKMDALQGIFKTLKQGAMFVFNAGASFNCNIDQLIRHLSCYKHFVENYHPLPKRIAVKLLSEVGYRDIEVREVDICLPLPSLDAYLRWSACSLHVEDYANVLCQLQRLCDNADDLSYLYDKEGRPVYTHDYVFGYCKK